jgi:hypothetical protein
MTPKLRSPNAAPDRYVGRSVSPGVTAQPYPRRARAGKEPPAIAGTISATGEPHDVRVLMSASDDPVLDALDALEGALAKHAERAEAMRARIAFIRRLRAEGLAYREIVPREEVPLIVELVSESSRDLDEAGGQFRRAEARALYDEGMTMDEIAEAFNVSRQRVSALLREPRAAE